MHEEIIYLDHAATTPLAPEALESMMPFLTNRFGSASTVYSLGREAKDAIEQARQRVAWMIGASPEEIFFTSAASESNNWTIHGVAAARAPQGGDYHIMTSAIEHHAILEPCHVLERGGARVDYLDVDAFGFVDPSDIERRLSDKTILVSIMHANNEVGTIEPVEEIGRLTRAHGAHFHVDAAQTAGHIPVDVDAIGCDSLAMSAHKIHGPKGCGALYVRKGTALEPLIRGGKHENGQRAGTHNVPGIVGFGKAAELATHGLAQKAETITSLRNTLVNGIEERIEGARLNGDRSRRLPNNVSFSMPGIVSGDMIRALDAKGICVSSGSACTSGSDEPSHVLSAMGVDADRIHGSLRMSLGKANTQAQIDRVLETLPRIVEALRSEVRQCVGY